MPSPRWIPIAKDEQLRNLTLPGRGAVLTPDAAKDLAVAMAWRGVGNVAPNPLVGAVIVDDKHGFVAAGAHEKVGGLHGEIAALTAVGGEWRGTMRGHTLYGTLEPCAHEGKRTPPCAPQLVEAGFARVVIGALDPHPLVDGRGLAVLRAAGIDCFVDPGWSRACEDLAAVYLKNARTGRPFVGLKAAASLDGIIAQRGDQRRWITGARARQYGHFLRLCYDAIIVGRATVEADDPTLDPRDTIAAQGRRTPLRVVLDPQMTAFNASRKMFEVEPERVVWVIDARFKAPPGVRTIGLPVDSAGLFAAADILTALKAEQITSVLVEGGAGTYSAFFKAALVDKLHLFQAPRIFGPSEAVRLTDAAGRIDLGAAKTLDLTPLGDDWVVEATWESS